MTKLNNETVTRRMDQLERIAEEMGSAVAADPDKRKELARELGMIDDVLDHLEDACA
jgi:hypothetical protein